MCAHMVKTLRNVHQQPVRNLAPFWHTKLVLCRDASLQQTGFSMDGGANVTNAKCAPLPTECRHGEDAVCHTADSGGGGEDQTSTGIRGGSDQAGSRNEGWCSVVVAEAPLQHCRLVSFSSEKCFVVRWRSRSLRWRSWEESCRRRWRKSRASRPPCRAARWWVEILTLTPRRVFGEHFSIWTLFTTLAMQWRVFFVVVFLNCLSICGKC